MKALTPPFRLRLQAWAAGRLRPALGLPALPVLLAPFVLLGPVLFAGKALFWGTPYLQFVPWWSWAWETLRLGHLPLWNPQVGMGAPLLANYQSALFYPPNWLYFVLAALGGIPALAWGQALLVALHLAWGGLGMSRLARSLGLNSLAQTVSGLAFGLCGYLVARGGFLSIISAAAWLPWILVFTTSACITLRGPQLTPNVNLRPSAWKPSISLILSIALQLLAGHAQTAWYTLLLAGMWAGYWGWLGTVGRSSLRRLRSLLAAELRLGLAVGLAAALAAVQLLPTLEYLLQSQRSAAVDYQLAMTYSFWPWRLLTLLAPDLFGSPTRGSFWGYGNYWEDAVYFGLLPLLLALGAALKWIAGRRSAAGSLPAAESPHSNARRAVPFLVVLIGLALLFALGQNTPIFPWLYFHAPTFAMFQAPARYLLWAEFALALLAGIGAQGWRPPQGKDLYWTRLAVAAALAVTLGAGITWFLGTQARAIPVVALTFVRATALVGLWGLGAALLSLANPGGTETKPGVPPERAQAGQGDKGQGAKSSTNNRLSAWHWAVVLFVAADLLSAGWGLNPGVSLAELYRPPASNAGAARDQAAGRRIYLPEADERKLKFDRFFRFDTFDPGEPWRDLRAVLLPDSNLLGGQASANNFDPLVPGRYARWMAALDQAGGPVRAALLDLMDVGRIETLDPAGTDGVRFDPLPPAAGGQGRWRWAPCASLAPDGEAAWSQVFSGLVDFSRVVVLESGQAAVDSACPPAVPTEVVFSDGEESPNRVSAWVSAPAAGWVVLSDVWYPGWQAWVDGQPAPLLRANYLFRAVAIPSGVHEVTFTYRPLSFWLGLAVSLLAAAFVAFRWIVGRLKGRASHAAG